MAESEADLSVTFGGQDKGHKVSRGWAATNRQISQDFSQGATIAGKVHITGERWDRWTFRTSDVAANFKTDDGPRLLGHHLKAALVSLQCEFEHDAEGFTSLNELNGIGSARAEEVGTVAGADFVTLLGARCRLQDEGAPVLH